MNWFGKVVALIKEANGIVGQEWYHASPHELKPGTSLVPRGNKSPFADSSYYKQIQDRENHVWVSPDLDDAHGWRSAMEEDGSPPVHIYSVKPHTPPDFWDQDTGHSTAGATVLRKVFDAWRGDL